MGLMDNNMVQTKSMNVVSSGSGDAEFRKPEFKRPRRVYGVRHFPPGCGPRARSIVANLAGDDDPTGIGAIKVPVLVHSDSRPDDLVVSSDDAVNFNPIGLEIASSVVGDDSGRVLENGIESRVLTISLELEDESNAGNRATKIGSHDSRLSGEQTDNLKFNGDVLTVESPQSAGSSLSENLELPVNLLPGEAIGISKDGSSDADVPAPPKMTSMFKYPPRRKMLGVRSFPPNCGRNAKPFHKVEEEEERGKNESETVMDVNVNAGSLERQIESNVLEQDIVTVDTKAKEFIEEATRSPDEVVSCSVDVAMADQECEHDRGTELGKNSNVVLNSTRQGDSKVHLHEEQLECNVLEQNGVIVDTKGKEFIEKASRSPDEVVSCSEDVARADRECYCDRGTMSPHNHLQIELWEKSKAHLQEDSDVRKAKVAAQRENTKLSVLKKITKQKCGGLKVAAANVSEKRNKKKKKFVVREHRKSASTLREKSSHKSVKTDGSFKQEAVCDELNDAENDEKCNGSLSISGNLTPFGPGSSSKGFASSARKKVREILRLFHFICRKLVHEAESRSKKGGRSQSVIGQRVDCIAAKELRNRGLCLNEGQCIIGDLPGVEVGDEFQFRLELNVIGLHRQTQAGIDFVKKGRDFIAVSIVASAGCDDNLENSDVLDYTGHGGNSAKDKEAEDQKLEKGNLGLKNSIRTRNPVRVIRGYMKKPESGEVRSKVYVYDGLYNVEKYWQEPGPHGKLVFKFRLVRIPGQPELAWKQVKKSKKLKLREGLCVSDISQGKEVIPICAVNTVDNEKPPSFSYITKIMYPDTLAAPDGCGCRTGCSESGSSCSCVAKNGGEIPFNYNGAIVEAKDLVYECGPSCKCPPSCYNRVSQNGIKIQLEVFKTDSRGWGVRSLNSISSGSFICEYVGELLDDVEAERRTNDEYLFDIGGCSNDDDSEGDNGLPNFTIDAAEFGNVGRFINHSCSPNLYAQNVLYDHEDRRIPHIMLFAAENIPPLRELTYHYNYQIDQVRDSQGNIKMKSCYCGSSECTGRMY